MICRVEFMFGMAIILDHKAAWMILDSINNFEKLTTDPE